MALEVVEGFISVGHGHHVVALVDEQRGQGFGNVTVVVDQEDRLLRERTVGGHGRTLARVFFSRL
jgi:hypothetical protein